MKDREASTAPFFSVILPTRNRPELFRRALDSVRRQSCRDIEILVVDDGTADEFLPLYQAIKADSDPRISWHHQPQRSNGHGPSYSINTGAQAARGQYLCILDDDDSWEEVEHLARAREVLESTADALDVYYSNQRAYTADGLPVDKRLWLEGLVDNLPASTAGLHGTHRVTPAFLLSSNGFPHLNCTIVRRELYLAIGGMDEGIRYECEVDLYLRTLEAAQGIVYNPAIVARHNIPDNVAKTSVSTQVSHVQKRLSQIVVYQKNLARAPSQPIRDNCLRKLSMLHKGLAERFVKEHEFVIAARYARIALACRWSLKWQLYSLYLTLLAAIRPSSDANLQDK